MNKNKCDILIIGGGFYGCYIAEYFALKGKRVILCERENDLMQGASFVNQARVHSGYHYPRSVLTALRSRLSYPIFTKEFEECINDEFDKYYLIGKLLSKVSANQFQSFCQRIGAPLTKAPDVLSDIANPSYVEAAYRAVECAFDAKKLKTIMMQRLDQAKVEVVLQSEVTSVVQKDSGLVAQINMNGVNNEIESHHVFNCTYANINTVLSRSHLNITPLKHEMTEMCLVKVPDYLKNAGITLMCGPFFSVMPFPSTDYHTFSHVRYTPHYSWLDHQNSQEFADQVTKKFEKKSAWRKMKQDAVRYIPMLSECEYVDSIWTIKTILPASENNDSRPILFQKNYRLRGFHNVMGGKIDNVYDAISTIALNGLDQ